MRPAMKRWTDPLRKIVRVKAGAGCDVLTMECGHDKVETHKPVWGARTRCHGCRVWHDQAEK